MVESDSVIFPYQSSLGLYYTMVIRGDVLLLASQLSFCLSLPDTLRSRSGQEISCQAGIFYPKRIAHAQTV
jgi:hypothetical protein